MDHRQGPSWEESPAWSAVRLSKRQGPWSCLRALEDLYWDTAGPPTRNLWMQSGTDWDSLSTQVSRYRRSSICWLRLLAWGWLGRSSQSSAVSSLLDQGRCTRTCGRCNHQKLYRKERAKTKPQKGDFCSSSGMWRTMEVEEPRSGMKNLSRYEGWDEL